MTTTAPSPADLAPPAQLPTPTRSSSSATHSRPLDVRVQLDQSSGRSSRVSLKLDPTGTEPTPHTVGHALVQLVLGAIAGFYLDDEDATVAAERALHVAIGSSVEDGV